MAWPRRIGGEVRRQWLTCCGASPGHRRGTGGARSAELRVWTEVWWPLAGSFVSFISFLSWGPVRACSTGLHYYASVSSSEKWGVGSCWREADWGGESVSSSFQVVSSLCG